MAGTESRYKKIAFVLCFFVCLNASAATVYLTPLQSIQRAFDEAAPYDTVILKAGLYKQADLVIKKPVVLRGESKPVLDGQNKFQILSVLASNVVIEDLVFRNGGRSGMNDLAGIKISRTRNVLIRNNFFENMFFSIYFQESVSGTVQNNVVRSLAESELQSGNGIHCWKCDSMVIENNQLHGNRDGIYFEFVTHSTISNNLSSGNVRYGLHFMFSHNNIYTGNTFEKNGAGVAVMYTRKVTMLNNKFSQNWGSSSYGILLKEITDSHIEGNAFTGNTAAIYMEGSNRIVINKNIFESNGCAIRIQASCDGNSILSNNFIGNTFDVTTNGSLVLNKFESNYWDKYEGYDLNRDGRGDVPFHPVSLYSMIIERMPVALIFMRSFLVNLMDRTEKAIPSITPATFRDDTPLMKPVAL